MEKKRIRICHFTSAHDSHDDRIYLKECMSLSEAGYQVYLAARGSSENGAVKIAGCGEPHSRLDRILFFSRRVYNRARKLDCDIYHFHDPELLFYGLKLKRQGKKVIFDSHEDVPAQILDKYWIPKCLRRILSFAYKHYETYVVRQLDAVVAATGHIARCFKGRARRIVVIHNYPKLDDIVFQSAPFSERKQAVCYAGGISEIRGEKIMIEAMQGIDADLILAGEHEMVSYPNTSGGNLIYAGQLDRNAVNSLYGNSRAGLCLLYPTDNYIHSLPVKMFEYMAAGLPFVASDFPLWKKIAKETKAGICVNAENIPEIQTAVKKLLQANEMAEEMGRNGRKSIEKKYHWNIEAGKLERLYRKVMR